MDSLAPDADGRGASLQPAVLEVVSCLEQLTEDTVGGLVAAVTRLRSACGRALWSSTAQQADDSWSHACALWNAAVDAANKALFSSSKEAAVQVAWLRHMSCELLHALPAGQLQEYQLLQLITFCLKASTAWTKLGMWEQSDVVLAFAASAADTACRQPLLLPAQSAHKAEQLCVLLFDVSVARYLTAAKLDQQVVAGQALAAARAAAEDLAPSPAITSRLCTQLAAALHGCVAEAMLAAAAAADDAENAPAAQALTDPLSTAFELLSKVKAQHGNQQQERGGNTNAAAATVPAAACPELMEQLQQLEAQVLLDMAFCHLEFGKDPDACLRCIDALRQLETPESWSQPAVALLALQAFLAAGNAQQAEVEAAGIAVNDGADMSACLALILELLQAPVHMPEALKTVLELVLGRFPSHPCILLTFVKHALSTASAASSSNPHATVGAAGTTANTTAASTAGSSQDSQASYGQALELLVLHVLQSHQAACDAVKADPGLAGQLHELLYNHGVAKFEAKGFESAVKFFTASLDFAEDSAKASASRVLVTCHLLLRQHTQAANYCKLAESYQPSVVATSFLRFKLLLLQGDEDGVVGEVSHMATCSDFTPSMLYLACQEALSANAVPAARAALLKLLSTLQQQQQQAGSSSGDAAVAADGSSTDGSSSSVSEGWVLRALVKLDSDELDQLCQHYAAQKAAATAAADGLTAADAEGVSSTRGKHTAAAQEMQPPPPPQQQQPGSQEESEADGQPARGEAARLAAAAAAAGEAAASCAVRLSEVLHKAVARTKVLGLEAFSGDREAEACRLLEWMSSVAWNAGLEVTALDDKQPVAVLMHASAELLSQLPAVGPQHMKQQRLAYLTAAAAALEVHMAMPQHTASLKLAKKMCTAVKGVTSRLLSGAAGGQADPGEAFLLQLMFRVALYQQNIKEQLALSQQLVEHPAVTSDLMHKLADLVNKHPHKNPDVYSAMLDGVLRKLMASSSPDCAKVAEVMRRLLQQAASDADKLRLYRECASIVAMLPKGSFPGRELSWLVSTAWNTGLHHGRLGRHPTAVEYMNVATSLLPCCTPACGFSSDQQAMLRQAKQQQQALVLKSSTGRTEPVITSALV